MELACVRQTVVPKAFAGSRFLGKMLSSTQANGQMLCQLLAAPSGLVDMKTSSFLAVSSDPMFLFV